MMAIDEAVKHWKMENIFDLRSHHTFNNWNSFKPQPNTEGLWCFATFLGGGAPGGIVGILDDFLSSDYFCFVAHLFGFRPGNLPCPAIESKKNAFVALQKMTLKNCNLECCGNFIRLGLWRRKTFWSTLASQLSLFGTWLRTDVGRETPMLSGIYFFCH